MDSRQVESLLEKYWNCETSLEEEKQLKAFFASENVPPSLKETAELFSYFENQRQRPLADGSFDANILKKLLDHMVFVGLVKEHQIGRSQPKAIWFKNS